MTGFVWVAMEGDNKAYAGLADAPEMPWFAKGLKDFYRKHAGSQIKKVSCDDWVQMFNNYLAKHESEV